MIKRAVRCSFLAMMLPWHKLAGVEVVCAVPSWSVPVSSKSWTGEELMKPFSFWMVYWQLMISPRIDLLFLYTQYLGWLLLKSVGHKVMDLWRWLIVMRWGQWKWVRYRKAEWSACTLYTWNCQIIHLIEKNLSCYFNFQSLSSNRKGKLSLVTGHLC